jgi:hypothetical protein
MSAEQFAYLTILNFIEAMPEEDQEKVKECEAKLQALVTEYGEHGRLALALVGARETAQAE